MGFTPYISENSDLLVVSIPPPVLLLLGDVFILLILVGVYRATRVPRTRRRLLVPMLVLVAIFGALFTPAKVTLNAKTHQALISGMFMFIPHRRIVPLGSLESATVRTADLTSALVLVHTDGHGEQLMPYTQMWGLDEAANAINSFLAAHRSAADFNHAP